jgi:hypothetical protein
MYVYAFPPVAVVGHEWDVVDPVSRGEEMFTGEIIESAAERRRRVVSLAVEGAAGDSGGYMRALKRLLRGGLHAVRLYSTPANHLEDVGVVPLPGAAEMIWTADDAEMVWTAGGAEMVWVHGAYVAPSGGAVLASPRDWHGMGLGDATHLPPSQVVARPGQFVTVYSGGGLVSTTRMLIQPIQSDAAGAGLVVTETPFPTGGSLQIGTRETGIFKAEEMPRWQRGLEDRGFQIGWSFREIFADEVRQELVEVDPWGTTWG